MSISEAFIAELRDRTVLSTAIRAYVPGLKKVGREWVGICPFHEEKTPSFTVSDEKQFTHCFGCGAHGDIFAFLQHKLRIDFPEAVRRVANGTPIPEGETYQRKLPPREPPKPALPCEPIHDADTKHLRGVVYPYPDATGNVLGVVVRYQTSRGKTFAQYSKRGGEIVPKAPDKWPLFNAPALADAPSILVVEGEKIAIAASKYLTGGMVATCWPGGANAAAKPVIDWTPLAGKPVVCWPDNDEPGRKAMAAIKAIIPDAAIVDLPAGMAEGWDLADALPGTLSETAVCDLIARTAARSSRSHSAPFAPLAPAQTGAEAEEQERTLGVNSAIDYLCLGYRDGFYYFFPRILAELKWFDYPALTSARVREFVKDEAWWDSHGGIDKPKYQAAGDRLQAECVVAGMFDDSRIRGRGVWLDDSGPDGGQRIVANLGENVFVRPVNDARGVVVNNANVRGAYVYPRGPSIGGISTEPADALYASKFLDIVRLVRWTNPLYGELLAGWCMTALICGIMHWRPHIWITGPMEAGKSTAMNAINLALAEAAIKPQGPSSAAGIRHTLKGDALPVVFDEAEGEGPIGVQRRHAIIELMRQSSKPTEGRILMGSATGDPVNYQVRSQFCLASVGTAEFRDVDASRITLLTLAPAPGTKEDRDRGEMMERLMAELPKDFAPRMLARALDMGFVIRESARVFKRAIFNVLHSNRSGDQLGALMAGAWALRHDAPVTDADAAAYIASFELDEWKPHTQRLSEEAEVLNYIIGQSVTAERDDKTRVDRTLGQLCATVTGSNDGRINPREAIENLSRFGIVYQRAPIEVKTKNKEGQTIEEWVQDGFLISRKVRGLDDLMKGSRWPEGYGTILLNHPEARKVSKRKKFAGILTNAIWLPRAMVVSDMDAAEGAVNGHAILPSPMPPASAPHPAPYYTDAPDPDGPDGWSN